MSWKQEALKQCASHNITFDDQSDLTHYRAVLRAAPYHWLWDNDAEELVIEIPRNKGTEKADLWYKVYNSAITGSICLPGCVHWKF